MQVYSHYPQLQHAVVVKIRTATSTAGGARHMDPITPYDPCNIINIQQNTATNFLVHLLRFSFTSNNITYCQLGNHPQFRYFDFFPLHEIHDGVHGQQHESMQYMNHQKKDESGTSITGSIPVWGIARILSSPKRTILTNVTWNVR